MKSTQTHILNSFTAINLVILLITLIVWFGNLDIRFGTSIVDGSEKSYSLIQVRSAGARSTTSRRATADVGGATLAVKRRVFPQLNPSVCVCVLSCGRLNLLRRTLSSVIRHFETSEPDLNYEIVWVDNGSPLHELETFRKEFQIEKHVALGHNYDIAYGLNTAFFRMCGGDFVLTLEEDWQWQESVGALTPTPWRSRMIEASIRVLNSDASLAGVVLRNETFDQWLKPRPFQSLSVEDAEDIRFRKYCVDFASGMLWGAYTNGASIYNRSRLLTIGVQYGEPGGSDVAFPAAYSEANYAVRTGLKYPCSVMIQSTMECERIYCNGVFAHIGDGLSIAQPAVKKEVAGGQSPKWILYDTPLYRLLVDEEAALLRKAEGEAEEESDYDRDEL